MAVAEAGMEQHRCDLGDVLPGEVTGEEGRGDGGETGGVTAGGGGVLCPEQGPQWAASGTWRRWGLHFPREGSQCVHPGATESLKTMETSQQDVH